MRFTVDARDRITSCDEAFAAFAGQQGTAHPISAPLASLWRPRVLEVCGPVPALAREQGHAQTFFTLTNERTRHFRLELERSGEDELSGRIVDLTETPVVQPHGVDPRFALLMENVTELVMVLDGSFRLLAFNNTFAAGTEPLTGRPLSVGDSLEDLLEPEARPTVRALVQRALAGEAFLIDAPITLRGGLHRTYEMSFNPVREAGTVVAAVCIARNVTDRRWEAASRHALLSAIPDAIVVLRRDGVVLDYYPSAEAPLHLGRDELVGRHIESFTFLQIPSMSERLAQTFATRETQLLEYDVHVRGEVRRRESRLRAISDDEAIFIVRDVTDARRLMSSLVTTDRMAALGTMAAGVAHELNNPLAFVSANLELMASHMENARPFIQHAVTVAQQGVARMATIVRDLGSFARSEDDRAVVDVGVAVDFALRMTKTTLFGVARVDKQGDFDARVCIGESRLGQVLVNLLVNAAQAFEGRGSARDNVVSIRVEHLGEQVVLVVSDNGIGMSEATLARVFDPFFTTKAAGIGTGLGLWVVQGIVRAAGGDILVESELGRGTTFRVRLPSSNQEPKVARIGTRARRRRLLLVDDDPTVLDSLARMLELVHDVSAVGDAEAARTVAGDGYDVILCDLTMPGTTGLDLLESLTADGHTAKLILMTGAPLDDKLRDRLAKIAASVLATPFKLAELDALIG